MTILHAMMMMIVVIVMPCLKKNTPKNESVKIWLKVLNSGAMRDLAASLLWYRDKAFVPCQMYMYTRVNVFHVLIENA